jgi:hypothetical protein
MSSWAAGADEAVLDSPEPRFGELFTGRVLQAVPEGDNGISGRTGDGEERERKTAFPKVMSAPQTASGGSGKSAPSDGDAEDPPNMRNPVTVWFEESSRPDLEAFDPAIEIDGYQVVVNGGAELFRVGLPASEMQVQVPPEFIDLDEAFELEVLARGAWASVGRRELLPE